MSPWGWEPKRTEGIWRYGASWMRPILAAIPWLTVLLLLVLLYLIGGKLTVSRGIAVELPEGTQEDGLKTELVALVLQMPRETLVFFDDSRYIVGDGASSRALADHLSDRVSRSKNKTLLVLADRRVASGDLFKLSTMAKSAGVQRLLFAEKRGDNAE